MAPYKEIVHEWERKDGCVPVLVYWFLSPRPHELLQSTDNEKE